MNDPTQPYEHIAYDEDQIAELARLAYVATMMHDAPNWALDLMTGGLDADALHRAARAWREFSFEPPAFAVEVERLAAAITENGNG